MKEKDYDGYLNSINLEPPKIYGEEQQRREKNRKKNGKKNSDNLSTAERRHKQNKKRRLKNSVRKAFISIALILVLLAVGAVLSLTVFFKIETINVAGSGMYSTQEIIDLCTIEAGDNLFLIDKEKCAENLKTRLPYIYEAEIKRELPSTILINITEATPEFVIKNQDETAILLDNKFKVLNNSSTEIPADAVEIQNAAFVAAENGYLIEFENEDVSECISSLADIIERLGITEATAISSTGSKENYIVYEKRIVLQLGNTEDLENKVYRGIAACEKLKETNPDAKGTMNLSSGKQFYFTPLHQ